MNKSDQQIIWEFIRGDLHASKFEKWIYDCSSFENLAENEFYLEVISTDFNDKSEIYLLKKKLEEFLRQKYPLSCECITVADFDILDEGDERWRHVRDSIFLVIVKNPDQPNWQLLLGKCKQCSQYWLIAEEFSINDIELLKRLDNAVADKIIQKNEWPEHFKTLEELLAIGKLNDRSVRFVDYVARGLIEAVQELKKDRPNITLAEIAFLLNIDEVRAQALCKSSVS